MKHFSMQSVIDFWILFTELVASFHLLINLSFFIGFIFDIYLHFFNLIASLIINISHVKFEFIFLTPHVVLYVCHFIILLLFIINHDDPLPIVI